MVLTRAASVTCSPVSGVFVSYESLGAVAVGGSESSDGGMTRIVGLEVTAELRTHGRTGSSENAKQ